MQDIEEISASDFDSLCLQEFVTVNRQPVVVRGLVNHWPVVVASQRGSEAVVAMLSDNATSEPCYTVVAAPSENGRLFYSPNLDGVNFKKVGSPLADTLHEMLKLRHSSAPHAVSIQAASVSAVLPKLKTSHYLEQLDPKIEPSIWVSNRSRVAAHYDLSDNIACVAAGTRRFTVFPPEQVANLYVGPTLNSPGGVPISLVDLHDPDLERFPNFTLALQAASSALLEPGDGIFIPSPWWHAVDSLEDMNVLINYWWSDHISTGQPTAGSSLMLSMLTLAQMNEQQRRAWKAFYDYFVFKVSGDPAAHLPDTLEDLVTHLSEEQRRACVEFLKQQLS